MNRIDIVGLTLAEIALVLLFSVLAVFAPAYQRSQRELRANNLTSATVRDYKEKLRAAEAETVNLKEELEKHRRDLRSVATPSCVEIDRAKDWLFTVTIRGADQYEIGGHELNLRELLDKYSAALELARKEACIHRIRLHYGTGVSGEDYDLALRRLEEYFYTRKLGPKR